MMTMDKTGLGVIYMDEHQKIRHALITADWNKTIDNGPVNLVIVADDNDKQDQYGRQLERKSSIAHISQGYETLRANCWCSDSEWISKYVKTHP